MIGLLFAMICQDMMENVSVYSVEELACPQSQTILLTYEPSSVKFYGRDYVNQFGSVLTSHEPEILKHPIDILFRR